MEDISRRVPPTCLPHFDGCRMGVELVSDGFQTRVNEPDASNRELLLYDWHVGTVVSVAEGGTTLDLSACGCIFVSMKHGRIKRLLRPHIRARLRNSD